MDLYRLAGYLKRGFCREALTGHGVCARGRGVAIVVQGHPAGGRACSLYLAEHPEEFELDDLVLVNRHATLDTLRGICECLVVSGFGQTGKYKRHRAVHLGDFNFAVALDDAHIRRKHHVLLGNPGIFEKDLSLAQRALADFIQGLTAGDPGQVQGNDSKALALHSLGRVQSDMKYRVASNGAIADLGGLLAIYDVLVTFQHSFNRRADGLARVGITQLLFQDNCRHGVHVFHGPTHGPGQITQVKTEFARLLDDVPQYGTRGDGVFRICHLVEFQPCRAHDFRPEPPDCVPEEALLFCKV